MADTTIVKVSSEASPHGDMGQVYLASGKGISMRLWRNEPPDEPKPEASRVYETVGYVISGRAELHLEGQMVLLEPGDSWLVPKGREPHLQNFRNLYGGRGDAPTRRGQGPRRGVGKLNVTQARHQSGLKWQMALLRSVQAGRPVSWK